MPERTGHRIPQVGRVTHERQSPFGLVSLIENPRLDRLADRLSHVRPVVVAFGTQRVDGVLNLLTLGVRPSQITDARCPEEDQQAA